MKRRLLLVDAPGGPHPSWYLPSIVREFEVAVAWLAVESPAARQRRSQAVAIAANQPIVSPGEVLREVRRLAARFKPDGLIAFSERVVHAAQQVADELGLPSNPPLTRRGLQDKQLQRILMAEAGMPMPQVRVLATADDCAAAVAEARFPAVLKPSVGMGSIATFRVGGPEELRPLWSCAAEAIARDDRIAHHAPVLLLEEELNGHTPAGRAGLGDYVSVEALTVDGQTRVLAVSDKLPLSPPFRENAHLLPSVRSPAELAPILQCARRAHRALGMVHGVTHTEIKLSPQGPRVIEVNGRVGGGVAEELALSAGYDLPLNAARAATGLPAQTEPSCTRYASYLTPQPPVGRHRVRRAPTREQLLADLPELDRVAFVVEPGEIVDSDNGTASNLLRAFAATTEHQVLVDLGNRIGGSEFFDLERAGTTNGSSPERHT